MWQTLAKQFCLPKWQTNFSFIVQYCFNEWQQQQAYNDNVIVFVTCSHFYMNLFFFTKAGGVSSRFGFKNLFLRFNYYWNCGQIYDNNVIEKKHNKMLNRKYQPRIARRSVYQQIMQEMHDFCTIMYKPYFGSRMTFIVDIF